LNKISCSGCDSPNRNEAVQYITEEKKQPVVICTEQPKSTGIEQTQINTNKVSNGYSNVQKPVNGFSSTHQNGHIENGHPIANVMFTTLLKSIYIEYDHKYFIV
jgi:hypothetical protein